MSKFSLLSIEELIEKLNSINNDSVPKWGVMNPSQMLKHCSKFIDLYLGKITVPFWYKYFGVTIGKLFLRYISKTNPLNTLKGPIHHPIYGKMKSEQVKFLIIHHTTHYYNQFGLI